MDRMRLWRACSIAFVLLMVFIVPQAQSASVTVKTVPLDPTNPTAPHVTYPLDASHEVMIVLGATVDLGGSTDAFTYSWDFGDGSAPTAPVAVTNPYDISAKHPYPFGAPGGKTWTAVVTVMDTATSAKFTGKYYVIQQANNLASRVDVAIDSGLWYLHQGQWRCNNGMFNGTVNGSCGVGGVYGPNGKYGGWDQFTFACVAATVACYYYESINGSNTQAFEVNGHFENGPSSDPYTEDVANGLARMFLMLQNSAVASKSYSYNVPPSCPNGGTTPCVYTFDGNTNGQAVYVGLTSQPMYQGGSILDAIVASGTPGATTHTGALAGGGLPGINGESYKNVVQDMADGYNYCQNTYATGGAWGYNCLNANYNDNSVSQWGAIGEIGANRGFGISTPSIITDANALWDTTDQCVPPGTPAGAFGYSQACYEPWGPYAVTPSGLVQLAMDKLGRGDSRWDKAETLYHDNFCNATSGGAFNAPRQYTYGMFSFTKSMLLHNPGGVLIPITFLEDRPAGTNPIDWYNSVGPESGGADLCDGVAQTLVKRQGIFGGDGGSVGSPNPTSPENGFWEGHHTEFNGAQDSFETGWTIIMLRKTVFISCVTNLVGKGTPSGIAPATIHLSWTGIAGAASYDVLRGTASGGSYTKVGNSTIPVFSDTSGLTNGHTYYYVLQPINNAGGALCQSNEAKITIPAQGR